MNTNAMMADNQDVQLDAATLANLVGTDNELSKSKDLFQNQDMVKLIEKYTEVDIPKELKDHDLVVEFWAILSKDIKLSFLDAADIDDFELLFDQAMLNFVMSRPSYEYTFEDDKILDQLKIYFIMALKRSQGTKSHTFNERILEAGSVNQTIRSNTDVFQSPGSRGGKGSFLSKLF